MSAKEPSSRSLWLSLVAASALFMLPILFAPLTQLGAASGAGGEWQRFGLQGQTVLSFSIVAREDGTAYYALTHTGLWRKIEGANAEPWHRIDKDLAHSALGAPLVAAWRNAPGRPLRMYALAGPNDSLQLYRSDNGGSSWQAVGPAPGQSGRPALGVLAGATNSSPDTIVIATTTGSRLQRSLDGGATWAPGGPWPEQLDDPGRAPAGNGEAVQALLVEASDSDRVLALSASGDLWLSENAGLSWHTAGLQERRVSTAALAVGQAEWAASTVPSGHELQFRGDNASEWETRPFPEKATGPLLQADEVVALAAEPAIEDGVYAAVRGGRIYRTVDGGGSWEFLGAPRATNVTGLAVLPATRAMLFATTDDGIWVRPVVVVTPTLTPTAVATISPTATPEATATHTRMPDTPSPTLTKTATATVTASATPTATETTTPTATRTSTRPPATATRRPSATPRPRLATPTSEPSAAPSGRGSEPPPPTRPPSIAPTAPSAPTPIPTPPIRQP